MAGHSRFTRHFPPVIPAARGPRVTADAYADLSKDQRYCTCCERPLVRKFAWLELDQRGYVYHDFGGVPPSQSQGWFPFGMTCAKRLLGKAVSELKRRKIV